MTIAVIALASALLTNAVQISKALAGGQTDAAFSFTGTITQPPGPSGLCTAIDETGGVTLYISAYRQTGKPPLEKGVRISTSGMTTAVGAGILIADCTNLHFVSCENIPFARSITVAELQSGRFDGFPIEIGGTVRECFQDETDPAWIYLSVCSGDRSFFAILNRTNSLERLKILEDAEVLISGVCFAHDPGNRRITGRMVYVSALDSILIRKTPPDPFGVPLLEDWQLFSPYEIAGMGKRRLRGKVIALLNDGSVLLKTGAGAIHKINFKKERPERGTYIEAAGLPETDLYRINLSNAEWKSVSPFPVEDRGIAVLKASDLFTDESGRIRFSTRYHGQVVRLTGIIMDLPASKTGQGIATLKSRGFTIPVDISADNRILNALSIGCTAEITGICFVQTENWSPCTPFPHTTGVAIAVRTPDDIRIINRPHWLSPVKMTALIAVLLLALVAIFIWNRILQHIIDRKSRQLLKGRVERIKATLRVDERTRLAAELHDTLSQNLSGVACQIAAAKGTFPDGAEEAVQYLSIAERMLLSCRTELRRCLWDLRSDVLSDANFNEAIRKTLSPFAIGIETDIQFNVPRAQLSDNTTHAVLCIIRELVANAIRHGKAKSARITGEYRGRTLSFSVCDDGRGFDPLNCAGPAEGHFGLEGIRERIKHLNGTFSLTSSPGKGTTAEVTLTSIYPKNHEGEA